MERKDLKMLKSFYESQGRTVWILDENWKPVWGTCSYEDKKTIPELLNVPWDCWKWIKKKISWNGNDFDCTLECSPECQTRILILEPSAPPANLPINESVTVNIAQIQKMAIDEIEHNLHEKNIHENDHRLYTLRSACYAAYRDSYIQRLLDRIYFHSSNEKELLRISSKLYEICENTEAILRNFATIEFSMDDLDPEATKAELSKNTIRDPQTECLFENYTLFCSAVLCGILLCCKEPEQEQAIRIKLNHHYERKEVEIIISITAMEEFREDRTTQNFMHFYDSFKGEEMLLNTFCNSHNGKWRLSESRNRKQITNHCSILLKSDQFTSNQLRSSKQKKFNPSFFDVYHVMLARICVADTNSYSA
ncbi:MAG: hypothetical protein K2H89_09120 [Oscillospiraceae bacterium]|nr:hypothetical protein [Oscillospiraceae bacterium]